MPDMIGPLGGAGQMEAESDVIFTAVLVGFALTRSILGQPFSFDAPHGAEAGEIALLHKAVDQITGLIAASGLAHGAQVVTQGISPEHRGEEDALITGRPGGEALAVYARNRMMSDPEAIAMATFEYRSALPEGEDYAGQYHGRGAYTGMVDDIVGHHTLIQPTLRRTIADPTRWRPGDHGLWGLIGGGNRILDRPTDPARYPNLSTDPVQGMGPLRRFDGIVQYTHGMSWAMREALRWGPWTTAYEMAVGAFTKKRASCFACTTYMWSSGFPASSTHLGRCESWAPLPDGALGEAEDHTFSDGAEGDLERSIARSMNERWHVEMYHQMRQGGLLLQSAAMMPLGHRAALARLNARLDVSRAQDALEGGKLFLDAISWHRSDIDRVCQTLGIAA